MKYLREISQIVTRYREKNLDLMDSNPSVDDEDYISKLYIGLRDGKLTSDSSAANYVYGSPQVDTKYTTLKNRLKRKLINQLFFLDIREKDFSEYLVARYQNLKALFCANTLVYFGARTSATKLFESTLNQALRYDFTSDAIQCVVTLRNIARFKGSDRQYDKYDKLLKQLLRTYDLELKAQELYERLTIRFSRSAAEQPDLQDICAAYLEELEKLKVECHSFNFYLSYYRVKTAALQIAQQYQDAVKICDEAMEYFDRNKHIAFKLLYADFSMQKLNCYLYLRDYEKAQETVLRCITLIPQGGANWFILLENRFLLEMHSFHFQEAEKVFVSAVENPRFQFLSDEVKEKWQLFELYLDFALRQGGLSSTRPDRQRVNPERFLGAVPTFKKDKRGYNIAILILHVMLLLEQNDFGSIIGRMDALRTYRNRYLQVNTNRRSALFFKMLQIMESNSFDPKRIIAKSKPYFDRMSLRTADAVEAQDGLQILPFEWLWKTIINILEEKQKQGRI